MKLSIFKEVRELRKEFIEMRKMLNMFLDIFNSLTKMIDYNNQKWLMLTHKENDNEEGEKRDFEIYNEKLIHVSDLLRKMKKLEI